MRRLNARALALALGLGGAVGLGARAGCGAVRALVSAKPPPAGVAFGTQVPAVTLRNRTGDPVSLRDRTSGRVSLIAVLGARDCWSCGDYPVELHALRNRFPHLVTLLVGSDEDVVTLQHYFDRFRVGTDALLDPARSLLRELGEDETPLVLLYDRAGRLVFVDRRTGPQSAGYRIGELLPDLALALREVR